MKYDVLDRYRGYLDEYVSTGNISNNTAVKYYSAVKNLLKKYQFDELAELDRAAIMADLSRLKSKNSLSAAKNGLILLHDFDPSFPLPDEKFFKGVSSHKRNGIVKKAV